MPRSAQDKSTKSTRFEIRAPARQANLIRAGAARRKVDLNEYIVDSACMRAEMDLADQNDFALPPKAWSAFVKALDAPPKAPEGLKRLFTREPGGENH